MEKQKVSNEGMKNTIHSDKQYFGLNQIEIRLNISLPNFGQGKQDLFKSLTNRTQRTLRTLNLHSIQRMQLFKGASVPK
ncbi:hypothetical protein HMPREF9296_0281 [Prevotella disiens FB035-09AN]|uniref:Uncharacterized protein n=1 Tax=Prevotella disiens FB035-09AN TaxID=866771 RepID=E1KT83_9BACT|nr:hypothetical protein HMPREF9296_0281 [Prevotella disiens FB035-09AN]